MGARVGGREPANVNVAGTLRVPSHQTVTQLGEFNRQNGHGTRSVPTTLNLTRKGSHAITVLESGGTGCTGFSLIPVCNGGRCYYRRRPFGVANFSRNLFSQSITAIRLQTTQGE